MAEVIFKYEIPVTHAGITMDMPVDAEPVHVHEQNGGVYLWVRVPGGAGISHKRRKFIVRGTGHELKDYQHYIGTAHVGAFVWHVLEEMLNGHSG